MKKFLVVSVITASLLSSSVIGGEVVNSKKRDVKVEKKFPLDENTNKLFELRKSDAKSKRAASDMPPPIPSMQTNTNTAPEPKMDENYKNYKFNIQLSKGWNLVAIPLDKISTIELFDRYPSIDLIWMFKDGKWVSVQGNKVPTYGEEKSVINATDGFWLKSSENIVIDNINGLMPKALAKAADSAYSNLDSELQTLLPPESIVSLSDATMSDFVGSYDMYIDSPEEDMSYYAIGMFYPDNSCEIVEYWDYASWDVDGWDYYSPDVVVDSANCFWAYDKESKEFYMYYGYGDSFQENYTSLSGQDTSSFGMEGAYNGLAQSWQMEKFDDGVWPLTNDMMTNGNSPETTEPTEEAMF